MKLHRNREMQKDKNGLWKALKQKFRRFLWVVAVIGLSVCSLGLAVMTIVNVIIKRTTESRIVTAEEFAVAVSQWQAVDEALDSDTDTTEVRKGDQILERLQDLDADCILVLGAGVREGGKPSLMLSDRLSTSIALYESGVCDRLLMSGDHGRVEYDEVNVMKDIAVEAGIPSENIFMDHAGFNTYDSLYRAKHIFQAKRVIIVTQQYHLYRALYIARALGIEAIGVAAPGENYYGQTYREMREMAARTKDFLLTITKPEASIMGETIPVSGDGNVTNDK